MKKNYLLLLLLIAFSFFAKSQNISFLSDTSHVKILLKKEANSELDSIIYIVERDSNDVCYKPWKVYTDKSMKRLLYECAVVGDTAVKYNYWASTGKIKQKHKYLKKIDEQYEYHVWIYEEVYCENGQLIRKGYLNIPGKQHVINYYCNGNKRNEFDFANTMDFEGLFTSWYENGKKESEGNYLKNKMIDEWKYYKEDGRLYLVEKYDNGNLIESKKY